MWLGNDEDESWKAMILIQILAVSWAEDEGKKLQSQLASNPNFPLDSFQKPGNPSIIGCWEALRILMNRPYWNRVWIIQEISMGGMDTPILCGHRTVTFGELADATTRWLHSETMHIVKALIIRERILGGGEFPAVEEFAEYNIVEGTLSALVNRIPLDNWNIDADRIYLIRRIHNSLDGGNWGHPVNLLGMGRLSDATNPRDKVYGFMGLIDPFFVNELKPNYEHSVAEVYTDFSTLFMITSQRLDMLAYCHWREDQEVPSWVPDWSKKILHTLQADGSGAPKLPYRAGGDSIEGDFMSFKADKKKYVINILTICCSLPCFVKLICCILE